MLELDFVAKQLGMMGMQGMQGMQFGQFYPQMNVGIPVNMGGAFNPQMNGFSGGGLNPNPQMNGFMGKM